MIEIRLELKAAPLGGGVLGVIAPDAIVVEGGRTVRRQETEVDQFGIEEQLEGGLGDRGVVPLVMPLERFAVGKGPDFEFGMGGGKGGRRLDHGILVDAAVVAGHDDENLEPLVGQLLEEFAAEGLDRFLAVFEGVLEPLERLDRVGRDVDGRQDDAAGLPGHGRAESMGLHPVQPDRGVGAVPLKGPPGQVGDRVAGADGVDLRRAQAFVVSPGHQFHGGDQREEPLAGQATSGKSSPSRRAPSSSPSGSVTTWPRLR